jgi:hypothetical protein
VRTNDGEINDVIQLFTVGGVAHNFLSASPQTGGGTTSPTEGSRAAVWYVDLHSVRDIFSEKRSLGVPAVYVPHKAVI